MSGKLALEQECRRALEEEYGELSGEQWGFLLSEVWQNEPLCDKEDVADFLDLAHRYLEFLKLSTSGAEQGSGSARPQENNHKRRCRRPSVFGWQSVGQWESSLKTWRLNRLMHGVMWLKRTRPGITWAEVHRELSKVWIARNIKHPEIPSAQSLDREWRRWNKKRSSRMKSMDDSFYAQVAAQGAVVSYEPPQTPGEDEDRPWLRVVIPTEKPLNAPR